MKHWKLLRNIKDINIVQQPILQNTSCRLTIRNAMPTGYTGPWQFIVVSTCVVTLASAVVTLASAACA